MTWRNQKFNSCVCGMFVNLFCRHWWQPSYHLPEAVINLWGRMKKESHMVLVFLGKVPQVSLVSWEPSVRFHWFPSQEQGEGVQRPWSFVLSTPQLFFCFLKIYLFIHDRHREREGQRHRQWEKQAPCQEPDTGLDPGTPGSCPGPKAGAKLLSHPGIPKIRTC